MGTLRLNLGCGPHAIPGWENLDLERHVGVIKFDLRVGLPDNYANESVECIFSEHFIEHLTRAEALKLLRDCRRVLVPEGVMRISTPDLQTVVEDYVDRKLNRYPGTWEPTNPCQMVNEGLRLWGHQHVYDYDDLEKILTEAGFGFCQRWPWHQSAIESLRNLEVRPWREDLIVEAYHL